METIVSICDERSLVCYLNPCIDLPGQVEELLLWSICRPYPSRPRHIPSFGVVDGCFAALLLDYPSCCCHNTWWCSKASPYHHYLNLCITPSFLFVLVAVRVLPAPHCTPPHSWLLLFTPGCHHPDGPTLLASFVVYDSPTSRLPIWSSPCVTIGTVATQSPPSFS